MGCCFNIFLPPISKEYLDKLIDTIAPGLPVAQLMNGGIIKLEGANGLFNPNSLLDPTWLKGAMTVEEYRKAIDHLNRTTGYIEIGLSRFHSLGEEADRARRRMEVGMATVEQLNRQYPSVRFTYQQTNENVQINISNHPDPVVRQAVIDGPPVANVSKTVLFIMPQS